MTHTNEHINEELQTFLNLFGAFITARRKEQGYTLEDFATKVNMKSAVLSSLENGIRKPIYIENLRNISKTLKIPFYTLFPLMDDTLEHLNYDELYAEDEDTEVETGEGKDENENPLILDKDERRIQDRVDHGKKYFEAVTTLQHLRSQQLQAVAIVSKCLLDQQLEQCNKDKLSQRKSRLNKAGANRTEQIEHFN